MVPAYKDISLACALYKIVSSELISALTCNAVSDNDLGIIYMYI